MENIIMSKKEFRKGEVILKVAHGGLTQIQAAKQLRMSRRQIIRLFKRYKEKGLPGLVHTNRGKTSNRSISETIRNEVFGLIEKHYSDFGPKLIQEQLIKRHNLHFSREWIRKLMIKNDLWKVNIRKHLSLHQLRARRPQEGELVQFDGSYHDWFEGRLPNCCLLVMIDDATSNLKDLCFVGHETTSDCFEIIKSYIHKHGLPSAVYVDRHAVYKTTREGDKRYKDTQFERALKELDIELLHANTPQAKGRVERSNKTLQDRLPKLMRLENISSIEEANAFLEKYMKEHNKLFGRKPRDPLDAHRPLGNSNLDKILCIKKARKVSKQLTLQYENKTYQLKPKNNSRRLVGATVLLSDISGKIVIEHQGEYYQYEIYEEQPYQETVMDRKKIMAFLDKKRPLTSIEKQRKKMSVNF